jgi:TolB-like protein/tetratricopeptide (TPR) repeat protein
MPDRTVPRELNPGDRIGRYDIVRPLGRGGMGVVYVARDERLGRDVALKMIAGLPDATARSRFWREARAAASVNHPHICQVFEVDESAEGIFLTMELLEGEALDRRLVRGALSPQDAVPIALGVLGALGALHVRGLVHRDIKPSNVFVTPHGPKLLDFGLARPALSGAFRDDPAATPVTDAGMIVGTPQYMAPEQVTGAALDGRTDLYALGAVIFQMLAGRPPFTGSGPDILFAALKENPPALQGPPAVAAIDRVIRRAMRKDPGERYSTADQMAADLAAVALSGSAHGFAVPVRALTRIVVPPLRIARNDSEVAFLSFGLAEAVSGSLASLGDVVVRAPAVAARWSDEGTDPRRLAAEADVDLVVSSTLLRSGSQLRITTQLLDAPSSTLVGSTTVKGSMDDIFALEDALTHAAMSLITPRLTGSVPRPDEAAVRRDVPANPRAFELFLRGMEHGRQLTQTAQARDLFQQAIDADPGFAPAWAALGRCHRVYGKYYEDREANDRLAEASFRTALELSPDLPLAHRYFTHFESEHGQAGAAIARLLRHARTNRYDAQLFAGLVHACRYAGLFDASMAAHDEAMRLDPNVATSVEYTIAHLPGGAQKAALLTAPRAGALDAIFPAIVLGDSVDVRALLDAVSIDLVPPAFRRSYDAIAAFAHGAVEAVIPKIELAIASHVDPEALFLFGLLLIRVDARERGLDVMAGAVRAGYTPAATLGHNRAFDAVRAREEFKTIESEAWDRMRAAQAMFESAGGPEMLGLPAATRLA